MREKSRSNTLLMEIIIAVLFFMLSAVVLVRVFSTAKEQSVRAEVETRALAEAQSMADLIYAAEDPEAALAENGYESAHGTWTCAYPDFTLHTVLSEEEYRAGTLRRAEITAFYRQDTELFTLPMERYFPEEVTTP